MLNNKTNIQFLETEIGVGAVMNAAREFQRKHGENATIGEFRTDQLLLSEMKYYIETSIQEHLNSEKVSLLIFTFSHSIQNLTPLCEYLAEKNLPDSLHFLIVTYPDNLRK